jgi:hypothetical protein
MPFKPTDFTQVNHDINRCWCSRPLRLLEVQPDERVIDWFCGLGNFTLPLATQAREVLGIEGSEVLVARSRENARATAWRHKRTFEARNLFELTPADLAAYGQCRALAGRSRRARAPSRWPRPWPTHGRAGARLAAAASASSTSAATRPRWPATPAAGAPGRLPLRGGRAW